MLDVIKKNKAVTIGVVALLCLMLVFASPTRAIKINAFFLGCEVKNLATAEFEKQGETSPYRYICTNSELCDRTTGSDHSTWNVKKVVFIYIPEWAGNG